RQEILAVIHELPPSMLGDIRWWALAIEASNPFAPIQGDATVLQRRDSVLRLYCGERNVIGFRPRHGGLNPREPMLGRQKPGPLASGSKSVPSGFYAKRLLGTWPEWSPIRHLACTGSC